MKFAIIFVVLVALSTFGEVASRYNFHKDYRDCKKKYPHNTQLHIGVEKYCNCREMAGLCPKMFMPVCDTDGELSSNKCILCAKVFQNLKKERIVTYVGRAHYTNVGGLMEYYC